MTTNCRNAHTQRPNLVNRRGASFHVTTGSGGGDQARNVVTKPSQSLLRGRMPAGTVDSIPEV
jgi:hypothetical protein